MRAWRVFRYRTKYFDKPILAGTEPPVEHHIIDLENQTPSVGLGSDEIGERVRLVIDGVDGRVHHVELDASRAEEVGRGMIVAAGSAPSGPRAADRNITDVADAQSI